MFLTQGSTDKRTPYSVQYALLLPLIILSEYPSHVLNNWVPATDRKHCSKRQPRENPVRRIHDNTVYRAVGGLERGDRLCPEPPNLSSLEEGGVAVDIDIGLLEFVGYLPPTGLSIPCLCL